MLFVQTYTCKASQIAKFNIRNIIYTFFLIHCILKEHNSVLYSGSELYIYPLPLSCSKFHHFHMRHKCCAKGSVTTFICSLSSECFPQLRCSLDKRASLHTALHCTGLDWTGLWHFHEARVQRGFSTVSASTAN